MMKGVSTGEELTFRRLVQKIIHKQLIQLLFKLFVIDVAVWMHVRFRFNVEKANRKSGLEDL